MAFAGPGVVLDDAGDAGRVSPGVSERPVNMPIFGGAGVIDLGDGDHGGVPAGSEGDKLLLRQGFRLSGEVDTGHVDLTGTHGGVRSSGRVEDGGGEAGVAALELGALGGGEKGIAPGDRLQTVLGEEEGVVLTEALSLTFDISKIAGVVFGDLLPVVLEVAADAVLPFQFQVMLLDLFQ